MFRTAGCLDWLLETFILLYNNNNNNKFFILKREKGVLKLRGDVNPRQASAK